MILGFARIFRKKIPSTRFLRNWKFPHKVNGIKLTNKNVENFQKNENEK